MTNNPGRPRSVEPDTVLAAAMRVFRMRGYEATTMKHLERATGLLSGSLHHAFGGKRALFLAALEHYNAHVVRARIELYLKGESPVEELRALFRSTLDEPGGGHHGCLLTNTAVELAAGPKPVRAKVSQGLGALLEAFEGQARLASPGKSAGVQARTALRLLHAYQGLLVLVRFGHPRAELEALIDDMIHDILRR